MTMTSPDLQRSVSKRLKYYFDVRRLEDNFDLSGPECPREGHPLVRVKSSPHHGTLHDRSVKHYFKKPVVRETLTQLKPTNEGDLQQEKEIQKSIINYMRNYHFNAPCLSDLYYAQFQRSKVDGLAQKRIYRNDSAHQHHRMFPREGNSGPYPPQQQRRSFQKENKRILNSTCQLLVATEAGVERSQKSSSDESDEGHEKVKSEDGNSGGKGTNGHLHAKLSHTDKQDNNARQPSNTKTNPQARKDRTHKTTTSPDPTKIRRNNSAALGSREQRKHDKENESRPSDQKKKVEKVTGNEAQRRTSTGGIPNRFQTVGKIADSPKRAKSAKYRSDIDNRSSLFHPKNRRLVRSYDRFAVTRETGIQTSAELLRNFNPSDQVLPDGEEIKYHIDVHTGNQIGASTKANIYVVLIGDVGRTKSLPLSEALTRHKIKFKRDQHDVFELLAPSVGKLERIKIGHTRKEPEYKWFVESVTVRDFDCCSEYKILCQRWLCGAYGDQETMGEFPVKSSCTFSREEAESMKYDSEEPCVAWVRTENHDLNRDQPSDAIVVSLEKENSDSLIVEAEDQNTQKDPKSKGGSDDDDDDEDGDDDDDDFSSEVSKGAEVKVPVLSPTSKSAEKQTEKKDDFFDRPGPDLRVGLRDPGQGPRPLTRKGPSAREASDHGNNNILKTTMNSQNRDGESNEAESSDSDDGITYPESYDTTAAKRQAQLNIGEAIKADNLKNVIKITGNNFPLLSELYMGRYAPIHLAVFYNRPEILSWMTVRVEDIDVESVDGCSAFQLAAKMGHVDCLKVLFDMGAKVNYRSSKSGSSALHYAAQSGQTNSVKWLLKKRADQETRDADGNTPLDLAIRSNHDSVVIMLTAASTVKSSGKKSATGDKELM